MNWVARKVIQGIFVEIIKRKIFKHNMSCKDCKEPYSDKETLERHLRLENSTENVLALNLGPNGLENLFLSDLGLNPPPPPTNGVKLNYLSLNRIQLLFDPYNSKNHVLLKILHYYPFLC